MCALPATISFESTDLTVIDHQGRPWLAAADLARALGYTEARKVTQIYKRHEDEFTSGLTEVLKLSTSGENKD